MTQLLTASTDGMLNHGRKVNLNHVSKLSFVDAMGEISSRLSLSTRNESAS